MTDDNSFEISYWGNCCNTFDEEQKHYVYAKYMGLKTTHFSFDVGGKSIIDVGGGPVSMLLKCKNLKKGKVCDPLAYPEWTILRYKLNNIDVQIKRGEDISEDEKWDEAWIYNCLQHVDDPLKIIQNCKKYANMIRIFEWIDIPPHDGHPHMLTKDFLDSCIGASGNTVYLAESGCYGHAYYGVFTAQ